jgi:hypothetical protein
VKFLEVQQYDASTELFQAARAMAHYAAMVLRMEGLVARKNLVKETRNIEWSETEGSLTKMVTPPEES